MRNIFLPRAALLLGVLLFAGCGGRGEIRPEGDTATAKSALSSALDAWKAGETPNDLQSRSPVVWMGDEDWKAGRGLAAYEIDGEPELNGSHWRVYAKLTVSQDGKTSPPERVCYAVTLGDAVSIIRSDFLH